MTWLAVVPLKGRGERKTRLAERLSADERRQLSERLFDHVVGVLRGHPAISAVALLSDLCPEGWRGSFFLDEGRGLNIELSSLVAALKPGPLLVIHADLPLVLPQDISALLARARQGCAIAPDREGTGTNAIALRNPSDFGFAFGPGSFARHLSAADCRAGTVLRRGLALDIDTPDDLDAAIALGFSAVGAAAL